MGWKKSSETTETTPQVNMALVHEAYMLVRQLRGHHPNTADDHELVHRFEKFFTLVFDSETTANVMEAFTRGYTHAPQAPQRPSLNEDKKQSVDFGGLIKNPQNASEPVIEVGKGTGIVKLA